MQEYIFNKFLEYYINFIIIFFYNIFDLLIIKFNFKNKNNF